MGLPIAWTFGGHIWTQGLVPDPPPATPVPSRSSHSSVYSGTVQWFCSFGSGPRPTPGADIGFTYIDRGFGQDQPWSLPIALAVHLGSPGVAFHTGSLMGRVLWMSVGFPSGPIAGGQDMYPTARVRTQWFYAGAPSTFDSFSPPDHRTAGGKWT